MTNPRNNIIIILSLLSVIVLMVYNPNSMGEIRWWSKNEAQRRKLVYRRGLMEKEGVGFLWEELDLVLFFGENEED